FVAALAWSPDGRRLVGACYNRDGNPGAVVEWDAADGQELSRLEAASRNTSMAYADALAVTPDGRVWRKATAGGQELVVNDWPAGKARPGPRMFNHRVMAVALTRDAGTLAALSESGF